MPLEKIPSSKWYETYHSMAEKLILRRLAEDLALSLLLIGAVVWQRDSGVRRPKVICRHARCGS
jgi:hypothetical protein